MAKKRKRKYSKSSGRDVKNEMHRYKRGKAKSGPGGKGGKVKSRKQAIAIGLSKARKKGKKVPKKKSWSTNKRGDEREGDDPGSAARQFNALPPAGSSRKSYVRLPKVKYDDVARVECHAINISRLDAIFLPPDSSCPQGWTASDNYCFRDLKE